MRVEHTLLLLAVLLTLLLLTRIFVSALVTLLRRKGLRRRPLPTGSSLPSASRILAVLGSGGHTAEMLALLTDVVSPGCAVTYAVSGGDLTSAPRARSLHAPGGPLAKSACEFATLPRARYVGEGFVKAAPRAALSVVAAVPLLVRASPQVVLCNGPGTSAVVALVAVVLNAAGMLRARIVYAESVARVTSLSLSGVLLYPFAHRFLVQWPQLMREWQFVEYHGRYS